MIGTMLQSASPIVAHALASTGRFGFLVIDAEHSAAGLDTIASIVRASHDVPVWVRLSSPTSGDIPRLLDLGVTGLIAPRVEYRWQAEEFTRKSLYPPRGDRGLGYCPANSYGAFAVDHFKSPGQPFLIIQIESQLGIEHATQIFPLPGLSGYMVGPYDLSASLGCPGDFLHPDYLAAVRRIQAAAKRSPHLAHVQHQVEPGPLPSAMPDHLLYSIDLRLMFSAIPASWTSPTT